MGRAFDTGSGFLAGRLKIEGLQYEWVSDRALEQASVGGCVRIDGLLMDSIAFGESIDPGTGELQTDGMNVQIVEDPRHRTGDLFVMVPQKVAYLLATVTAAATVITLDPPLFVNGDVIYLGTEAMVITAGGGTGSVTVLRAFRGTSAQAHFVDPSLGLPPAEITDRPVGLTGRRAKFYTYEPEDSVTGDGTLRWRGIVAMDPTQNDPSTWTILIDPPTSALDQDLSGDTQDGVQPRGISYPNGDGPRLRITLTESSSATFSAVGATGKTAFSFPPDGGPFFFETQQAFLDALNAAIIASMATALPAFAFPLVATAPSLTAVANPFGAWDLQYKADAVNPRYLTVQISSTNSCFEQPTAGGGLALFPDLADIGTGFGVRVVVASASYAVPRDPGIAGAGTVPRGVFGYDPTFHGVGNAQRLYLGGFASGAGAAIMVIEWPSANGSPESTDTATVASADATERSINANSSSVYGVPGRIFTSSSLPTIRLGRFYSGGTVASFINAIVALAADNANAGRSPFFASDDFDSADMSANVDAITRGRPWVASRVFATYANANIGEIIKEENKMIAASLAMTTTGQMTIRELLVRAATDPNTVAIGENEILSGAGGEWPTFERQALGSLNTLIVKSGYNPRVDEWTGRTFRLRDIASYARQHTTRSLTIEPKSYFAGGDMAIDVADVTTLAQAYFGLLGAPYSIVQAKVPITRFGVLIGDGVTVTCSTLPNPDTGGRGIVAAPGIVIGRKWELMRGTGMLRILVPHQRVAGYSPSSRVASNALVAGTTYDVTLALSQPRGYAPASAWVVGDTVKLRQWDAIGAMQQYGTISAVTVATRVIRVVLSAAIPGGVLNLCYGSAGTATVSQRRYLYVADYDRRIVFPTPTAPRTLAG